MLELFRALADFVLHIDAHLVELAARFGPWLYALLAAVVFCESGIVLLAFLPGDSLLFAVGALAAQLDSPLALWPTALLLTVAAVVGDFVNYALGAYLGPAVFTERSRLLRPQYVQRTEAFYAKYGKKTIFLSRFVPIVRTFAPFLAGIGRMDLRTFSLYNVSGGACWILSCLLAGHTFGQLAFVRDHFSAVVLAIVAISVAPLAWELMRARRGASAGHAAPSPPGVSARDTEPSPRS
jgi:membrane-associated protein